MKEGNARKQPFLLHKDAFECLLAALHPDRSSASVEYERLRERLIRFFVWQGALEPEQLADASLDRLTMKLYRGEQILDLRNYLHGIARMVLRESRNQRQRDETLMERAAHFFHEAVPEPESDELFEALEETLAELPPDQRGTMLEYYAAVSHAEQVSSRMRMAAELGISTNALRNRMLRLRIELEQQTLRKLSRTKKVGDKRPAPRTYW